MSQAFSLYVDHPSPIHALHPLTKLALSGLILVSGLSLPGIGSTYLLFLFAVIPLAALARVLRPLLRITFQIVLPFAISLFLIRGFLWPGGTPWVEIGPLSLKVEGVLFTVESTGRILVVVGSFILLSLTTRIDALMTALVQKGLSPSISYIILSTLQIVPDFQRRAATIVDAQRARGLETEGAIIRRIRALPPLVGPLVIGSIIDVEERAIALEARGFTREGPKTSLLILHDTIFQIILRWLIVLIGIAIILLRLILIFR